VTAGSRKQAGGKAKGEGARKKLPAALAKRVESEVAAKRARLGALHEAGIASARVTAVATKPGQEANVRIEGVPISALGKLRTALGKKG
jgi:hypothetical protein